MKTTIQLALVLSSLLWAGRLPAGNVGPATPAKPNILIILADDLGYGDVRCYNPERGKISTPNMDRLATQGMRFTDAHASVSVCTPSRYSLLTGRYSWRSRLQKGIVGAFDNPLIPPERMTIAGLAKQNGYHTDCIGKWHLGWDWPIDQQQKALFIRPIPKGKHADDEGPVTTPAARSAWQEVFTKPIKGGPTAVGFEYYFGTDVPNWPPYCFIENERTVGIPSEWLPRQLVGGALTSAHGPALKGWKLEEILPTLRDKACGKLRQYARTQEPFLIFLSLTAPHTPLAINEPWRGKSGLNAYADFVMETDAVVGQVLETLEQTGLARNTLVLFTSDNGKAGHTGAFELEKMGHFSSGPLRGYKQSPYEGGHRMPFIARWPGIVAPGKRCDQLIQQADIMATLAEILGVKLPDNAGEDSVSFLPLLKGGTQPVRTSAVSCATDGTPTIRDGAWKLIVPADPSAIELYNLTDDIGETRNLAAQQPERVARMKAALEKLIVDGRSTLGAPQKNDVEVIRYPGASVPAKNTTGNARPAKPTGPSASPRPQSIPIAVPGSIHRFEGKSLMLASDKTWKKADLKDEFTRVLCFHLHDTDKAILRTGFQISGTGKGEISMVLADVINRNWQISTCSFRLPGSAPFTLVPKPFEKGEEKKPISNDFIGVVGPGRIKDHEISLYLRTGSAGWDIKIGDEIGGETEFVVPFALLPADCGLKPFVNLPASVATTNEKPVTVEFPAQPAAVIAPVKGTFGSIKYRLHQPKTETGKLYPLVVCIHGAQGVGEDNRGRGIQALGELLRAEVQAKHPCFLLAPQKPAAQPMWADTRTFTRGSYDLDATPETVHIKSVHELIMKVMKEHPIDPKRVYVTGQSMGGYGTWDIALRYPDLFAAVVPLCGAGSPKHAARLKDVALWAFHGAKDDAVPVSGSREMAAALKAAGATKARYTEYPDEGHIIMDKVWSTEGLLDWLFAQTRN